MEIERIDEIVGVDKILHITGEHIVRKLHSPNPWGSSAFKRRYGN